MAEIIIDAKSSTNPEPYQVVVTLDNGKVSSRCNCQAGQLGQLCKHNIAVLRNDNKILFSSNQEKDLEKVNDWLVRSSIRELLIELDNAELEKNRVIDHAKKKFSDTTALLRK